jgi:hypothetical protein
MKSRSPFDFAQGRLFGDDNQNGQGQQQQQRHGGGESNVYIPPFAMELRRLGHPVIRGW